MQLAARRPNVTTRSSSRRFGGRVLRAAAAMVASVGLAAGLGLHSAGEASANPVMGSVDSALKATGEPGPHRVPGHYFTSPGVPAAQKKMSPAPLMGPSTPVLVGRVVCTIAAAGYDAAGNKVAVTAAHCGGPGSPVTSLDVPEAGIIGKVVKVGNLDYSVIRLRPDTKLTRSYGRVNINHLGGSVPGFGQNACKTGVSTGTKCGPVLNQMGANFLSHICASYGDSGAPVYSRGRLVGIINGGFQALPSCTTPVQGPLHSPTISTSWNAIARDMNALGGSGAGFRLP